MSAATDRRASVASRDSRQRARNRRSCPERGTRRAREVREDFTAAPRSAVVLFWTLYSVRARSAVGCASPASAAPAPADGNWPNPPIRNLAGFLVRASLPTRCLRGPVLSCRAPRSASDRCRPEHCRAADHHHHTGGRVLESPDMAKRRRRTLQGAIGARGARFAARCE